MENACLTDSSLEINNLTALSRAKPVFPSVPQKPLVHAENFVEKNISCSLSLVSIMDLYL